MRCVSPTLLGLLLSSVLTGQNLESAVLLGITPVSQLQTLDSRATYDVALYKIRYFTTDVDGSSTIASGALTVPMQVPCDSLPLVVYQHGTVLLKTRVPSGDNETIVPKVAASTGAVSVAPDYLGLGDNAGLHPYLHGKTEATAALDLIRASREFLGDSLGQDLNGQVFVSGYSQGGHAAMAMAKYVHDQGLQAEFQITGAAPASGPYDLSGSQNQRLMSGQAYTTPGYIVYMLFGLNRVYQNIFSQASEILKSPYDTTIPPLLDGTSSIAAVHAALPNQITGFIQDSTLNNFSADSVQKQHPLWLALLDNDNYDWGPSHPVELYYCTQDEQVDFSNALAAEAAMQARGANVTAINKGPFNHGGCYLPSMQAALDFMLRVNDVCQGMGTKEAARKKRTLELYPNPASEVLNLNGWKGSGHIQVYNFSGQLIHEASFASISQLEVSSWPAGVYWVRLSHPSGRQATGRVQVE